MTEERWVWYRSNGARERDGSLLTVCDDCGRTIRRNAWELVDHIVGRSYCRRHGWPIWQAAVAKGEAVPA